MPDISKELNDIMNARYGADVRQSIHDGIKKVNNNLEDVGVDELLDVRKTAYNTVLPTAGDSVRDQIKYILDGLFCELFEAGKNLFDKNRVIAFGKFINSNGQEQESEHLYYSHPIPVKPNTTYYMSRMIGSLSRPNAVIYDKNNSVVQTTPGSDGNNYVTTVNNAAYMIVNGQKNAIDKLIVAESSTFVPYEPFKIKFKENWSSNADLKILKTINEALKNLGNASNKIILLGDSIVAGVGGSNFNGSSSGLVTPPDTSGGLIGTLGSHGTFYRNTKGTCWANYLKSYIESYYPNTQVINNGCSGINSKTINDYFDTLVPSDATKIILCVGINDRHNGSSYVYTKDNIKGIIQKAKNKGIDIAVLTNINPLLSNDEQEIRNYNSYQVASAIKDACSEESIEVGNLQSELRYFLYLKGLELNSSLLPDGIHPNDTLYEYMYNVIKHILFI